MVSDAGNGMSWGICYHRDGVLIEKVPRHIGFSSDELIEELKKRGLWPPNENWSVKVTRKQMEEIVATLSGKEILERAEKVGNYRMVEGLWRHAQEVLNKRDQDEDCKVPG